MTVATSARRVVVAAGFGGAGGALAQAAANANGAPGVVTGAFLGTVVAALSAALLRERVRDTGEGLIWGLAVSFLLWLGAPVHLVLTARSIGELSARQSVFERMPELIAWVVCFGAPLGTLLGALAPATRRSADGHGRTRAIVVGGLAGVVGCLAFARIAATAAPFGLDGMGQDLLRVGGAAVIGAGYGLLFQRAAREVGAGVGYGLAYGMLWWCLGPLTVLPLWRGEAIDWSGEGVAREYGAFVAHVFFGLLLGLVYAIVDRVWVTLFVASDPLRAGREGIGTHTLLALGRGGASGLVGGLVFSLAMLDTGILPYVASLVGGSSPWLGFAVHLLLSVLIGMVYGLLFRRHVTDLATALGSGLLYGLVWWFLGQLTLFPWLLGEPFDWSLLGASTALPSLIGHLAYGAATAFGFAAFELRHRRRLAVDPRWQPHDDGLSASSAAAPLWVFALGLGVSLPIVLG